MASAINGSTASSIDATSYEWEEDLYYDFTIITGDSVWDCPYNEAYYAAHGRWIDFSQYLNYAEYEAFRASGATPEEFRALRESGLWFCVMHDRWLDPVEYGIIFLWEMPYVDEPWLEDGEVQELLGETIWACPDEEEYYMTYGIYRDPMRYMSLAEYEDFRASGMSLAEFMDDEPVMIHAMDFSIGAPHVVEDGGSIDIRNLPFAQEAWLEEGEVQEIWGEAIWACPDEEEYYALHGRYIGLLDYMTLAEYEIFRASGMRLAEFKAVREPGISLTELSELVAPDMAMEYVFEYFGYYGGSVYIYDLPIVTDEEWLDGDIVHAYIPIMPLSLPTLTVSRGSTTSTSVFLTGTISNPGGSSITQRGFWIRRDNQANQREVWVSTTSNTFSQTITGLQPNSLYHVRAVARVSGVTGTRQSNALSFWTPSNITVTVPGAPRSLSATPGTNQVRVNWQAPTSNGGAAIIRYEVSLNSGGWINVGTALQHTFTGLGSGTHTFRVRAINSAGAGIAASISAAPTVPAPTLTISRGTVTSTSVSVTGTISNPGGASITQRGFWIRRDNQTNQREVWVNTTSNTFSTTITGLTPNSVYHVRAVARTTGFTGHQQSAQNTFTTPQIITVPAAPQNLRTTPGAGQVTVNWSAPSNNGGAAITRYEVSLNNGAWMNVGTTLQHTFSGLSNATHTFRVRAVNLAGAGTAASISAAPTVTSPTVTLSRGAITSTSVVVTGTVSNPGGASITARGFWIRRDNEINQREVLVNTTSNTFTTTITGLIPNSVYHVRAITRTSGIQGAQQSNYNTFTTPPLVYHRVTFNPTPITPTGATLDEGMYDADGNLIDWDDETFSSAEGQYIGITPLMSGPITINVRDGSPIGYNNIPNPGGSSFAGWFTSGNVRVTGSTVPTGNITVFALMGIVITFNSHGGSVVPPISLTPGSAIGFVPIPIRAGYRFDGWFRTQAGGGSAIRPDEQFFVSFTLHARWTPIPEGPMIVVTFNPNGGILANPDDATRLVFPGDAIGDLPRVTRPGYTFLGWNTNANGTGTFITRSSSFIRSTPVWAIWREFDPFFHFYGDLGWRYPLNHPDSRRISSGFRTSGRPTHDGIDISRTPLIIRPEDGLGTVHGEPVFAMHGGYVIWAEWSDTAGWWVAKRSDVIDPAGNNNLVSRYLHMRDRPLVERHAIISQGTQIGRVGNTGRTIGAAPCGGSTGHLHIDINNNNQWASSGAVRPYTINPQRFFPHINFVGDTSTTLTGACRLR